nr:hypothetical protein Hi04_10k_c4998_00023 [uncultured bacterium]
MWLQHLQHFSLIIPAAIMLVAGFVVALRSVDVRLNTIRGARQVVSNLSYTVATVALCVAALVVVQGVIGFNIRAGW